MRCIIVVFFVSCNLPPTSDLRESVAVITSKGLLVSAALTLKTIRCTSAPPVVEKGLYVKYGFKKSIKGQIFMGIESKSSVLIYDNYLL